MDVLIAENCAVGRPKKRGGPMVSIKIEPDALELAKLAAPEMGETVGAFISRVVKREAAQIIENLTPLNAAKKVERARQVMQAESTEPPEPEPAPKARPRGKTRKGGE